MPLKISEKKKEELKKQIIEMRKKRSASHDVTAMIDGFKGVDASDKRYEKIIDLYIRLGGGQYGATKEKIIAKLNEESKKSAEARKDLKSTTSMAKYGIDGAFDGLLMEIAKNPQLDDLMAFEDENFPEINLSVFSDFCTQIRLDYGSFLFNGSVINNGYNEKPRTPEFVLWSPKGGAINSKWDLMVKKGRIPNKPEYQPKTAWCDPHAMMAFNVDLLKSLMIKAYYTGVTAKDSARGKKYKSNGGKFPDYWWPVEYIIIHEVLHFKQGDFYNVEQMSSLIDELKSNAKKPFHKTKFAHTISNITQDLINNWMISEKLGLPILTTGWVSEKLNMLTLKEESLKTGEPPLIVGMRIVMNDLISLKKEDPEEAKNAMENQQDQHHNDSEDSESGDDQGEGGEGQGQGEGQQSDGIEDDSEDGDGQGEGQGQDGQEGGQEGEEQDGQGSGSGEDKDGQEGDKKGKGKGKGVPSDKDIDDMEDLADEVSQEKPELGDETKNDEGQTKTNQQANTAQKKKKKIDDALDKSNDKKGEPQEGDGKDGKGETDSGSDSTDSSTDPSETESGENTGNWQDKVSKETDDVEFDPTNMPQGETDQEAEQASEDAFNDVDDAWDNMNEGLDKISDQLDKVADTESKMRTREEIEEAEKKRKEERAEAARSIGQQLSKESAVISADSALSWKTMINEFFVNYKIKQETYARMSSQTIANITASDGKGAIAIDPGIIKEDSKQKVRVVFCFDVSGSVWNQIGKANLQLWNYVKKFGNRIDECWFMRFSSENNYDIHLLSDTKNFSGVKLTPSGKRKIMEAGKGNKGEFKLDVEDIYPRPRKFSAIMSGEGGKQTYNADEDESSAIPTGGTDFTNKILNMLEAFYRRGCGIIFFTDSDCAGGQNLESMKTMLFDTFGVPPRKKSIGVCMTQAKDYVAMVKGLGTESSANGAWRITYFTNEAYTEAVGFDDSDTN